MAQRRQKPTLESRQPLAFLPAPTVLGHPNLFETTWSTVKMTFLFRTACCNADRCPYVASMLAHPLRPTKLPCWAVSPPSEGFQQDQATTNNEGSNHTLRYHWNDFFIRGPFLSADSFASHGVLKVRTGHESINQSQPCWALPHQAKGSNTEIRSSAHEQDGANLSTLTGT